MRSDWFDIVSGARKGTGAALALAGLRALSIPYAAAVGVRRRLYASGIYRTRRASVPVISVGNITAGGTGKTPLVEHLARGLAERGHSPAVVMRGYAAEPGQASDEATVLRANLGEGVPVVENPDRYRGVEAAAKESGADVAVLDDGFQHVALARDLDIVTVDATSPFGFGRLLPAGLLREDPSALARAQVIAITRADLPLKEELHDLRERVAELAPDSLVIESSFRPARLETTRGGEGPALDEIRGARVAAFCGIGNPYSFGSTIRRLGAELFLARRFPDHHAFSGSDLAGVARDAARREARCVLTTQKDAVRFDESDWPAQAPPLYVLRGEVVIDDGGPGLWALVESAIAPCGETKRAAPGG